MRSEACKYRLFTAICHLQLNGQRALRQHTLLLGEASSGHSPAKCRDRSVARASVCSVSSQKTERAMAVNGIWPGSKFGASAISRPFEAKLPRPIRPYTAAIGKAFISSATSSASRRPRAGRKRSIPPCLGPAQLPPAFRLCRLSKLPQSGASRARVHRESDGRGIGPHIRLCPLRSRGNVSDKERIDAGQKALQADLAIVRNRHFIALMGA